MKMDSDFEIFSTISSCLLYMITNIPITVLWSVTSFYVIMFLTCPIIIVLTFTWLLYAIGNIVYDLPSDTRNIAWYKQHLILAKAWYAYGRFRYGYDVMGFEKLERHERKGGVILVSYHGAVPIDIGAFVSYAFLRNIRTYHVIDKCLLKTPILGPAFVFAGGSEGSYEKCLENLREGKVLIIFPGGTREALFSGNNYKLQWGERNGFARLALEAKVPIIPMFTENSREAYRYFHLVGFRQFYEKWKIPFTMCIGGFPVKLRTHIGDPITHNSEDTAESLKARTMAALEDLIAKHQHLPGSITEGIKQRFKRRD